MFVLICNLYALVMWAVRLSSDRQQYNYVYTRLARASRPEIPRFRFNFKHASRDVGLYVHRALVDAFIKEYLEADGYFFIRLLAANASDFIVQEVLEQLWAMYAHKYGEADAINAENAYYQYRQHPRGASAVSQSVSKSSPKNLNALTDGDRKYLKQHTESGAVLLKPTLQFEGIDQNV